MPDLVALRQRLQSVQRSERKNLPLSGPRLCPMGGRHLTPEKYLLPIGGGGVVSFTSNGVSAHIG